MRALTMDEIRVVTGGQDSGGGGGTGGGSGDPGPSGGDSGGAGFDIPNPFGDSNSDWSGFYNDPWGPSNDYTTSGVEYDNGDWSVRAGTLNDRRTEEDVDGAQVTVTIRF
jgi:hypothetical protein